jgi:hypothetical protein
MGVVHEHGREVRENLGQPGVGGLGAEEQHFASLPCGQAISQPGR